MSFGVSACGDDAVAPVDAPRPIDARTPVDAALPVVDYNSKEGGEVRLEYLTFKSNAQVTSAARAISFLYDGPEGNGFHPFPNIPGCTDLTVLPPTRFPFAQEPTRQYLDVGQVIFSGGPQQFNIPAMTPTRGTCSVTTATMCYSNADCPTTETCVGATGVKDYIGRLHPGPWRFAQLANMGPTLISPDTTYDVIFTGSASWPAQVFKDVLYMPGAWVPTSPGINVDPQLVRDTPLTIEYTTPALVNKPADYPVNTLVVFLGPAANIPPVVVCAEEGTDGSITIPAETVNLIRAAAPQGGKFVRQHVSHVVRELTDGVTHNQKRIDFVGTWCYNYGFTVAP